MAFLSSVPPMGPFNAMPLKTLPGSPVLAEGDLRLHFRQQHRTKHNSITTTATAVGSATAKTAKVMKTILIIFRQQISNYVY